MRELKKALRDTYIDASSVVWTPIHNGNVSLARDLFDTRMVCVSGWDLVIFDWFVLTMRMQVILDSLFARLGSSPIGGGKKGAFKDWTRLGRESLSTAN